MSWGSVTVPSSAKRLAERDSSQQHAAQQRDAGSTTLNCLVDLDRLEPHPVQAQLVQDQAAASGGCGAAAGWLAALSEPPERLLDRHTVRQADTNPRDRGLHRGSITVSSVQAPNSSPASAFSAISNLYRSAAGQSFVNLELGLAKSQIADPSVGKAALSQGLTARRARDTARRAGPSQVQTTPPTQQRRPSNSAPDGLCGGNRRCFQAQR